MYFLGPNTGKGKKKGGGRDGGEEYRDDESQEELVWIQQTRIEKRTALKEDGLNVFSRTAFDTHSYTCSRYFTTFFKVIQL